MFKTYVRNKIGQFSSTAPKLTIRRKFYLAGMLILFLVPVLSTLEEKYGGKTLVAFNVVSAEVIQEEKKDLTLEEAKKELDAIVWGGESGKHEPKEGEILPVFDPSRAMYADCIRIGGWMHKDCLSYGPRQIKIGTIQHYWTQLYGVEISEKEARTVAEGQQSSHDFFMDCSIKIEGCVWNWTAAQKERGKVEILIKIIRKGEGL